MKNIYCLDFIEDKDNFKGVKKIIVIMYNDITITNEGDHYAEMNKILEEKKFPLPVSVVSTDVEYPGKYLTCSETANDHLLNNYHKNKSRDMVKKVREEVNKSSDNDLFILVMNLQVEYGHQSSTHEPFYKIDEEERLLVLDSLKNSRVVLFNSNSNVETEEEGINEYNSHKNKELLEIFESYNIKTHVIDLTNYLS